MRRKDLTGKTFGKLKVLSQAPNRNNKVYWNCLCECGTERAIVSQGLLSKRTISCGCSKIKHGLRDHPLYATWKNMMSRCYNHNRHDFKYYGGRGIKVCQRWHEPGGFIRDMGKKPAGFSLDRIDNGKGYSPSNCEWVSHRQQMNNTRKNRVIEFMGFKMSVVGWSRKLGISKTTLSSRLNKLGWDVKRALTEGVKCPL